MKKGLLSFLLVATLLLSVKQGRTQCTISNLSVQDVVLNSSTCTVTFNLSFEQEVNSGNKYAYIHLWTSAAYHTPVSRWPGSPAIYSGPPRAPVAADLVNTLGTIAVQFNGTATPAIYNAYPADATITPITTGLTITKVILPGGTRERETISGLSFTLPSCAGVVALKGDVWASQADNGKNVHCASQNLTFNINDPQIVSAFKVCSPRTLNIGIKNNGTASTTVQYKVYEDNGDNFFNTVNDNLVYTSTNMTIGAGLVSGASLTAADIPQLGVAGEDGDYWVEVNTVPAGSFSTVEYIRNIDAGCIPLPVNLKNFTAKRDRSAVSLKWETEIEQNNKGFEVQRSINGEWQTVGYVASKAVDGNSSARLGYEYTDQNTAKSISRYRLRQLDMDGKSKLSETRSVRGDGKMAKTIVYPNPSADGRVNVLFEEADVIRHVQIADMSGRVIRQWTGVKDNSLQVDNLGSGIYSIRIVNAATKEQVVERVVVNRR